MTKLHDLKTELIKRERAVKDVKQDIQLELNKQFDDWEELNKAVSRLNDSRKYTYVENDEYIHIWFRFDALNDVNHAERDNFEHYLMDRDCISVDWDNNCLTRSLGPSIIVNEFGDVLDEDSGKWIIHKRDYDTEEQRNQMIESWMTVNGYFPNVFYVDWTNDVHEINTKA